MKRIRNTVLILIALLIVLFSGHYFVVKDMNDNAFNLLLLTYGFNLGVTILIVVLFSWAFKNRVQQIGTVFLMSTGAKFLLFFTLIYPFLNMNGSVKSFSFGAFFIPYAICLTAEVLLAIKLMNKMSEDSEE